jgi:hypothetical protein
MQTRKIYELYAKLKENIATILGGKGMDSSAPPMLNYLSKVLLGCFVRV